MMPRAFTLVELLVTVSIMGVLAGLIVLGMSTLRRTREDAGCRVGLQRVGAAIQVYAAEHQGCYPRYDTNAGSLYYRIPDKLKAYGLDPFPFCPRLDRMTRAWYAAQGLSFSTDVNAAAGSGYFYYRGFIPNVDLANLKRQGNVRSSYALYFCGSTNPKASPSGNPTPGGVSGQSNAGAKLYPYSYPAPQFVHGPREPAPLVDTSATAPSYLGPCWSGITDLTSKKSNGATTTVLCAGGHVESLPMDPLARPRADTVPVSDNSAGGRYDLFWNNLKP